MRYKVVRCRLRELLAEKHVAQDDLATALDMKKSQVSTYVNNKSVMTITTAKTIAAYLNVHIDDLYEWERPAGRNRY